MAHQTLLWFVCLLTISFSSSSVVRRNVNFPCPIDCHCTTNRTTEITTYHCTSLDFVNKLSPKENAAITSLDISNISLHSLDKRLKKLINLEHLNLAYNKLTDLKHFPHLTKLTHLNLKANHIKSISAKHLPETLRSLDISHNYIKELPSGITKLHHLKHIALYENSFSCSRESLETRDYLLDNDVKIVGIAICDEPEKLRGQSWFHAVDFDEYFKFHDQEEMMADEPERPQEGSGEGEFGSGTGPLIEVTEEPVRQKEVDLQESGKVSSTEHETTTSDFGFDGSGDEEVEIIKSVDPAGSVPDRVQVQPEDKQANLGTNIFLVVFLLCLVCLLVYAVKKNREKKRETRRKRRAEKLRQRAAQMELMPKLDKPSDKQNGNHESVPLMNGQNGNSKPIEEETSKNTEPLLDEETKDNDNFAKPSAPLFPNSDVKSVTVKASEIPDSVPQTPILVSRSRTSDGNLVVTPRPALRNS